MAFGIFFTLAMLVVGYIVIDSVLEGVRNKRDWDK